MRKTENLGLSLYDSSDKMNITGESDSLNHNMELIDKAIHNYGITDDLKNILVRWCTNSAFTSLDGQIILTELKRAIGYIDKTTGISLNKNSVNATCGMKFVIVATLTPEDANEPILWTSSNVNVATVVDGEVTCKEEGTTVITATSGECSATCNITVGAAVGMTDGLAFRIDAESYTDGDTEYVDDLSGISISMTDITKQDGAMYFNGTSSKAVIPAGTLSNILKANDGIGFTYQICFKSNDLTRKDFLLVTDKTKLSFNLFSIMNQDGYMKLTNASGNVVAIPYENDGHYHLYTVRANIDGGFDMFVDGNLIKSNETYNPVYDAGQKVYAMDSAITIGAFSVYDVFSNISLKHIGIYDKYLSNEEILNNYNAVSSIL